MRRSWMAGGRRAYLEFWLGRIACRIEFVLPQLHLAEAEDSII